MLLALSIGLPIIVSFLFLILDFKKDNKISGWACSFALLVSSIIIIYLLPSLPYSNIYKWITPLDLSFGLLLDKYSAVFSLAITIVSTAASFYSIKYEKKKLKYFNFALCFFASAMNGAVLSTNLVQFYFFWEAMVLPAYFLIVSV